MNYKKKSESLRDFYVLWITQSLSQLGSAITAFALSLWLYDKTGSALSTAALTICTYAPYVVMSIFAGAVSDKFDKKKTMLVCDTLAAFSTATVLILFKCDCLSVWHLYLINLISGLMNTVQQPASEVAYFKIIPKKYYQKTEGLQSLSRSLVSIGNPVIAGALYGFGGLPAAISVDLLSFGAAFVALAFFIRIPKTEEDRNNKDGVLKMAEEGLGYLKHNPMILYVILFMSGVNFISSAFNAALPAYIIPNARGGHSVYSIVSSCSGIAMVAGSLIATNMPKPKNRVRVIYLSMLFSLGTENFLLALSRNPVIWCIAQALGWIFVPVMSTNQNVIMKNTIPENLQGRVYACRNTFQFFTIPIGLAFGGFMVDNLCEPLMLRENKVLKLLFGSGKGSGAALVLFLLGIAGVLMCFIFGNKLNKFEYSE